MNEWRGGDWDRISAPHAEMGAPVLDRLDLDGGERVLDAGCGSGRLTELLMEQLPRGSAVALDGSASMIDEARRRLERFGDRVTYVHADLGKPPLPVDGEVDAIMSTATLHWIVDHDALFEGLETADRFHMAGVGETARRLAANSFVDINGWLEPRTIEFERREDMLDYIVVPYLRPATGRPDDELYPLADAIADRLGALAIDYVRLNVTARKG